MLCERRPVECVYFACQQATQWRSQGTEEQKERELALAFFERSDVEQTERQPLSRFVTRAFLDLGEDQVRPVEEAAVVLDADRLDHSRTMEHVQSSHEQSRSENVAERNRHGLLPVARARVDDQISKIRAQTSEKRFVKGSHWARRKGRTD